MRFSFVPALLCLAAAATAQDVVTIVATEGVTRESAGNAKPGLFELTRNGSTGDLVVSVDVQGTALPGSNLDFRFGSNVSPFSVTHIVASGGGTGTYTGVATVTIAAPPSGTTATATAVMGISGLSNLTAGGLYAVQPSIVVSTPPGGVAANILPSLTYSTIVPPAPSSAGTLTNGTYIGRVGSAPAGGVGAAAVGTITVAGGIASLSITSAGSGYSIGEQVDFSAVDGGGNSLTLTGIAAWQVVGASVVAGGRGYTAPLTGIVPVRDANDLILSPDASLDFNLNVVDFTITNAGSGYTKRPAVTLTGAIPSSLNGTAAVDVVRADVTIPNGERTVVVKVIAVSDLDIEQAETVTASVVSSGSTYIAGPAFSATVVIQDDDMTLGWSVVDENAQEAFDRAPPEESTYALRFTPEPGVTDDPRDFDRYLRFQVGGGSANLGDKEDYIYTYMYRHAGQPTGKTMQELRTSSFDFKAGWRVHGSTDEGENHIPYLASSIGVLSIGDMIQFGSDNLNLYMIIGMNSTTITITPPLVVAVPDKELIRNNLGALIDADGGSQGTTARSTDTGYTGFPGDDGIDLTYTPIFDSEVEASEVVRTSLWASNDYLLTDPQVMDSTIGDDDLLIDIAWTANAARPAVLGEPGTTGSATITLSAPAPRNIDISYRIQGTAIPGTDYDTLTGHITIAEGESSVAIPIVPKASATGLRTVIITLIDSLDFEPLGSPTGDVNPSATVNIIDEIGIVSIAATDAQARESDSDLIGNKNPGEFTVSIDRLPGQTGAVSVVYSVSGKAISGADFEPLSGNVTIPDGLDSVTIDLNVLDDYAVEDSEGVTVTLESAAGYSVDNLKSAATVQILDDEPRLQVAITGQLIEPSTNATVTISYPTTALNRSITVHYTVSGTATSDVDFTGLAGIATIQAGQNSTTFPLTVLNDAVAEGPESVVITLDEDPTYGLDDSNKIASVTLIDDEPSLGIFAIGDGSGAGAEPTTAARVLVYLVDTAGAQLTTGLSTNVSFSFSVNNGTAASGNATFGSDYTLPGSVPTGAGTILAGQTFATVSIPVLDDTVPEGDEGGTVVLLPSTSYNLVSLLTSVPFTILDNEATVEIASTTNGAEPSTPGAVVVRNRGGVLTEALTVKYKITGTARAGTDYVGLSGTVVIPAGSSQVSIPVVPIDNHTVDGTRSVIVTIKTNANYNIAGAGSGTVNIADDDGSGSGSGSGGDDGGGSGSSCGAGSGVALFLGFGSLAFLARFQRRRSSER